MSYFENSIDFTPYQWNNRLLLLFAGSPGQHAYREQQRTLARHRHDLVERDLLVFALFDEADGEGGGREIAPPQTYQLRQRYELEQGSFAVILVGKDGGEKLRFQTPVAAGDLFGLIDSMPVREQELQQ